MISLYVIEIKKCLQKKCYFSALALALTLPDVCGSVEYPRGGVAERYIGWYDKYLGEYIKQENVSMYEKSSWLRGEIVYKLRNNFLHTGVAR